MKLLRGFFLQQTQTMKKRLTLNRRAILGEARSFTVVLFGAMVLSVGYALFIVPHKLVPGGIFGLSIIINDLTEISVGLMALLINIPLLLWGSKVLGGKAALKTAFFMVVSSALIDLILHFTKEEVVIDDILVSGIFGGLLVGLSVFIVKDAGATTGGNDILSRILSEKINLRFEQIILIVDALIILLGVFVFKDFTLAAYCLVTIVATSKTLGHYLKENEKKQTILVFSENNNEIQESLESDESLREKTVELIHNDSDGKLILIAKNSKELSSIERIIHKTDPKAHVLTLESNMKLI